MLNNPQVAVLHGWSLVMENTVVFIRELKRLEKTSSFSTRQLALLLDHSVLYHFVLNQRDNSVECSAMLEHLLTKLTDTPLYLPKFPLPELRVQDKELINQMIAPSDIAHQKDTKPIEQAQASKAEGDAYSKQEKYGPAIEAYRNAIANLPQSDNIWILASFNLCRALFKTGKGMNCLKSCGLFLVVFTCK